MPEIKYNPSAAKNAMPIGGKRTAYTVEGRAGLVLMVSPGMPDPARRWYVRYQVGKGAGRRQGFDLIGDLSHWSHGQAWDRACEIIRQADSGMDPAAERRLLKADAEADARTVGWLFAEWLDHTGAGRTRTLSPRSRQEKSRVYRLHIEPKLGALALRKLDKAGVKKALDEIREATTDEARGFRGAQALVARQILHAMCEYAVLQEYMDRNPCRAVAKPVAQENPAGKQSRALTDDELRAVWAGAAAHVPEMYAQLFKLALLLGRRRSELTGIRKDEIDFADAVLTIPADREGNKAREVLKVPLPPLALAILKERCGAAGLSPFVFQPRSIKRKAVDKHEASRRWKGLRKALGIEANVRLHDVRTLITGHLTRLGVPSEVRSHVLSHMGDVRRTLANRTYNEYDFLPEKRRALELWEGRLLEIVEGRSAGGSRW